MFTGMSVCVCLFFLCACEPDLCGEPRILERVCHDIFFSLAIWYNPYIMLEIVPAARTEGTPKVGSRY